MKKLTFKELIHIDKLSFYNRGKINKNYKNDLILKYNINTKNINNVRFEFYYISNKLKDEDKRELLKKYNNIDFYICNYEYASELHHNVLLVCNYVLNKK